MDGIEIYLRKFGKKLFHMGYNRAELEKKIELIRMDLIDRFDESVTLEKIERKFGTVDDLIKNYEIKERSSPLSFLRWIPIIAYYAIIAGTIVGFFGKFTSFGLFQIDGSYMEWALTNKLFQVCFALMFFIERGKDLLSRYISEYDPRYPMINNSYLKFVPILFTVALFAYIEYSFTPLLSHIPTIEIVIVYLMFFIFISGLGISIRHKDSRVIRTGIDVIFSAVVLPDIMFIGFISELNDFVELNNVIHESWVIDTVLDMIYYVSIIWALIPIIVGLYLIITSESFYAFVLGNIFLFSFFIKTIFGHLFYPSGHNNFGFEESYVPNVQFVVVLILVWNIAFLSVRSRYKKFKPRISIKKEIRWKEFAVIFLLLLPLLTTPNQMQLNVSPIRTNAMSVLEGENFTQSISLVPLVEIPQDGKVNVLIIIPEKSDISFKLTKGEETFTSADFVQKTSSGYRSFEKEFMVDVGDVLKFEYQIVVYSGNTVPLSSPLQIRMTFSTISGWLPIWQVAVLLLSLVWRREEL